MILCGAFWHSLFLLSVRRPWAISFSDSPTRRTRGFGVQDVAVDGLSASVPHVHAPALSKTLQVRKFEPQADKVSKLQSYLLTEPTPARFFFLSLLFITPVSPSPHFSISISKHATINSRYPPAAHAPFYLVLVGGGMMIHVSS